MPRESASTYQAKASTPITTVRWESSWCTLGAFAELERDLIAERVSAGLLEYRRAHKAGEVGKRRHSRSGKDLPHGRPARVFRRDRAIAMRKAGKSWRAIATELGVPQSTIRDALRPT